jgi:putative Mg2+ transporter-C (MgtC) family protein
MDPLFQEVIVLKQLVIALLLGAVLGFERLLAGKEAGMRTFGLVSVGSCLFVVIGELVAHQYVGRGLFTADPLRLASSIVTGIGFIGGGLIIFQHELKGLTTAAVLWVASAIGVAVGFELYLVATFTTFLTLFVTVGLWFVERYLERKIAHKKHD